MGIFDSMSEYGHEQLVFCHDKSSKLKAIIAVHDTTLGPALGGCRMWPYEKEGDAVNDAIRLSYGMSLKSAACGANYGGGKAVIWGDPHSDKSEELFRAFGLFVQTLKGRFITGTDVGTTAYDFVYSRAETSHLVALPEEFGGSGDSSIITAYGVFKGMKACSHVIWGTDSLRGRTVAVQGLGKVGRHLVRHLMDEGAEVVATDTSEYALKWAQESSITLCEPGEIYDVPCDIFSPNALGAVLNPVTIPRLKCKAVAGAANNQLADESDGQLLHERGILYAPDFVVNAGGLIQVADEREGFNRDRAFRKAAQIYNRLLEIFSISRSEGIPTAAAARLMAERRIENLGRLNRMYVPHR